MPPPAVLDELEKLVQADARSGGASCGDDTAEVIPCKDVDVNFEERLGYGAFGDVYKGQLMRGGKVLQVAVKRSNSMDATQAKVPRPAHAISVIVIHLSKFGCP
jgi:hypothetical protein